MAKKAKPVKLSDISSILFECNLELKTLGDAVEDNGDKQWVKGIDDLIGRVNKTREAIQNKNVVID